jgi:hypothetical protein
MALTRDQGADEAGNLAAIGGLVFRGYAAAAAQARA